MKKCPACNRTYTDDTLSFCLIDGSVLSASFDTREQFSTNPASAAEATSPSAKPSTSVLPAPTLVLSSPQQYAPQAEIGPDSRRLAIWIALAALVFVIILAGFLILIIGGFWVSKNKNSSVPSASSTPSKSNATPQYTPQTTYKQNLKSVFSSQVGDYTLQGTYERSELKGDDKLLPGADNVIGAVYKSSTYGKAQIMVGSYSSAADAEAARSKSTYSSSYPVRWTKGNLLFVASDAYFKDRL